MNFNPKAFHPVIGTLSLFVLVLAVYLPVLPGSFLMDDWHLIETDNPLVNGSLTPLNIWFQTDFTLSTFALWLQRLAWGHSPGWYHVVNLSLHAVSAMLVWRLLAGLKIPGAWFAAALYAVHPVCVNSVARIAEIKNTLSLPFFLLSFLAYLHYEALALYPADGDENVRRHPRFVATLWYVLALLSFVLALLAKTSTVMLPLLLVACVLWQRRNMMWTDWLHLSPFFTLSMAFGLMSVWFQKHQALFTSGETLQPESFGQRFVMAGHVIIFYLGKAILPLNLNLVYPQWSLDAANILSYLPLFIFAAALIECWRFRQTWGRHVLFGLGCFSIALFPAMGFFDSQFLTRWQVSDHLQYLPLIAPVALAASGLSAIPVRNTIRIFSFMLIFLAAFLAFQRATVFSSEEKLLADSIAKNPAAASAQNDFGILLAKKKDYAAATEHFEAAIQADSKNADAHSNLGHALVIAGKLPEAEAHYKSAISLKPYDGDVHKNFAELLRHEGRNREAIFHYQVGLLFAPDVQTRLNLAALLYQTGDAGASVGEFHRAVAMQPDNVEALNNLAWVLATCGDEAVRNGPEAVRFGEKACSLTSYTNARMTGTLAAAYAEAKRYPEAVAIGQTTVNLANAAGDKRVFYIGNQLLLLYRDSKPFHEPLANSDSRTDKSNPNE